MERKIGEVFTFEGKQYEVCETECYDHQCGSCAFYCNGRLKCWDMDNILGDCASRWDGKLIVFKEASNIKKFK